MPYSDEGRSELERFEMFVEERESVVPTQSLPILDRAVEHAIKLALTVSVATDWMKPVITREAMTWGRKLAWLSTATMMEETRDKIADNQREADMNRILGNIQRAGKDGITEGKIADNCRSIDKKRRVELLSDLIDAGRVVHRETLETGGRKRKRFYAA